MDNVDRSAAFIHSANDPILGTATDAKQVSSVGLTRESEVTPGQRRTSDTDVEDSIEPIHLLDGKWFTVFPEICRQLINVPLCARRNPQVKSHKALSLTLYRFLA